MKWILVSIIAFVMQQFLPWWSVGIAGFIFGAIIFQSPRAAFFNGFAGVFLLWGAIAMYIYYINEGLLASRLALLIGVPYGFLMILITAFIGGIAGGLGALSGRFFRDLTPW